jgi:SAM-dependent methyltransferase
MGASNFCDFEFFDMEWSKCEYCGCIQLSKLIDLEKLYAIPHNPAVGKTWDLHNKEFSNLIKAYFPQTVLDLGGANLKLAKLILSCNSVTRYDVLDFSAEKYEATSINDKVNLIVGSIDDYNSTNTVDCIILSHTLEHLYNPIETLSSLRNCLTKNGKIFVSVPNIKSQLKDGFMNALHFEHTYFIDHDYIKMIGGYAGLKLIKKIDFSSYNSFYIFESGQITLYDHPFPNEASKIFTNFAENLQKDVQQIVSRINNEDFYIFGAHVFSQYLINAGLPIDRVISIIDNDDNKIGKILYGTTLAIKNPNIIASIDEPLVLLRVAQYDQEIRDQLLSINCKVRFL